MKKNYWQDCWQHNQIGFNQTKPNELLQRYFKALNLKVGSRVFVPLCGKSIDMIWFLNQGYDVVGVELSEIACEAFFKENRLAVQVTHDGTFTIFRSEKLTLFAGDFFKLSPEIDSPQLDFWQGACERVEEVHTEYLTEKPLAQAKTGEAYNVVKHSSEQSILGRIDAVYDRAALIALPLDLRQQYSRYLLQLISSAAPIFLITTAYPQQDMNGPPFSVDEAEVRALYGEHYEIQQLYNKSIKAIPEHLRAKGLVNAMEQVYFLSPGRT